uniref:Uncharacterized protein n=1 Tax=Cacopsylla melanoneura TaxID=428564 RepID=A0A8D8LK95_9HEMI
MPYIIICITYCLLCVTIPWCKTRVLKHRSFHYVCLLVASMLLVLIHNGCCQATYVLLSQLTITYRFSNTLCGSGTYLGYLSYYILVDSFFCVMAACRETAGIFLRPFEVLIPICLHGFNMNSMTLKIDT